MHHNAGEAKDLLRVHLVSIEMFQAPYPLVALPGVVLAVKSAARIHLLVVVLATEVDLISAAECVEAVEAEAVLLVTQAIPGESSWEMFLPL